MPVWPCVSPQRIRGAGASRTQIGFDMPAIDPSAARTS
jgi:hypothetical protein